MNFKHPEILYFLPLLLVPILVHLFQLRKFKTEYFTNVKFLKELIIQTRKSSKLKKYLLLATRLLLLLFLILAFAQPFFKAKDSDKAQNEMYIVLDNSYSMQAKGKKGELLKRAVQDLLEHCPENTNFSLVTCTDNFWNVDIKAIQRELQNLQYSPIPFEPESLIAKIKAHQSANEKDIVIITDAVGLKEKNVETFAKDDNINYLLYEAENTKNVSVDSVFINHSLDNFYEIGVKFKGFDDDFENLPVSVFNTNKLVAKTLVSINEKEKTVNFNLPKEDFNGYVSINDNGLEYDNTYYFSITKPDKNHVLAIGESAKNTFLQKIYTADEFIFTNTELSQLDYNAIEKQDAIVLNELTDIPSALITNLKIFVQKGGNVVVIPNESANISLYNSLLSAIGGLSLGNLTSQEKMITKINFNHPVFTGVFEKKVTNFQYPKVKKSFSINSTAPSAISYNDNGTFLANAYNNISYVYLFAAPLNKINSNFQNSPLIVPVFYNMAKNNENTGVNATVIGENRPLLVDARLGKDEIVTIKNDKESFIPIQQILNNKVKLTINDNPKIAGNFTVYSGTNALENVSFNYNRIESNLNQVNAGVLSQFHEFGSMQEMFNTFHANRTDSMIWKWFIALALLCLVLEVLIQKFVK